VCKPNPKFSTCQTLIGYSVVVPYRVSGTNRTESVQASKHLQFLSFVCQSFNLFLFWVRKWFMILRKGTRKSIRRMNKIFVWYHRFVVFLLLTRVSLTSSLPHTDNVIIIVEIKIQFLCIFCSFLKLL
jgi:hypothetical protein